MKKLILLMAFLGLLFAAACAGPSSPCSPACAEGQVCISEGGAAACKKSCTKNEDCDKGQVCHTDDDKPHCDAEE